MAIIYDVHGYEIGSAAIDAWLAKLVEADWHHALDRRDLHVLPDSETGPLSRADVARAASYFLGANPASLREASARVRAGHDALVEEAMLRLDRARQTRHMVAVPGGRPTWYPSISWAQACADL